MNSPSSPKDLAALPPGTQVFIDANIFIYHFTQTPKKGLAHMALSEADMSWSIIWQELRDNLTRQPPCPVHPTCPHVKTLVERKINHILEVSENGICVRSHSGSQKDRLIETSQFETWWNHLVLNGSAFLKPGVPNNLHRWNSRIVGAILATCLPDRIRTCNSRTIIKLV